MSEQERVYDLFAMGRSSIDLYSNDIGAPFSEIKTFSAYVGGCPTNIAVAAHRLGLNTALLTAVGQDPVADFILRFLNAEGIDTRFIPRKRGARTSAVLLGIEPPDRFPLVYYRENAADIQLTIDDVIAAPLAQSRVLLVTGTGLSREPSRSATLFAIEQACRLGTTVFLDLDFRADQWPDPREYGATVRLLLPQVDYVLGTEEEVKAVMLMEPERVTVSYSQVSAPEIGGDLDAAVHGILDRGACALFVKRGGKGASVFLSGGDSIDAPGFPVHVYNTLGAGDAFAGGLIYGYIHGWDWYQAARMGNANGALVVTRHGCANFMGYEDEVLEFIAEHGGF